MHVLYVVRCVLWASCDFVLVPRYDGAVGVMLFPALVYDAALVVHRRAARLKKVTSGCASSASSTDNRPSCGLIKVGVAAAFFLALLRSFTLQYLGWFSLRRMCLCDGRMRAYRSLYSYPM
ncbi:hypothetical protein BCV70DRAFT_203999 [Testicularia cyperi]|uniref:Uncharacterized protein n=1 Tax=Testicularia cyperi TaxID=1882483 RepID=A0A317XZ54_9BASI|nr:hypothetical protein BCV70DRAFT_203999 [Testicularia cyperi]